MTTVTQACPRPTVPRPDPALQFSIADLYRDSSAHPCIPGAPTSVACEERRVIMPGRGNLLLELMAEDLAVIQPYLRRVPLKAGEIVCDMGEEMRHLYFPVSGAISKLTIFEDGTEIECALIGRTGCIGALSTLGLRLAITRDICCLPGESWRIPVERMREACAISPVIHERLDRYCAWVMLCTVRNGACNACHTVERRLCRWLLSCSDTLGEDEIALSQDVFAKMLGVQRSSINPILQKLRKDGLLGLERGRLRLLNREALLARSCECYGAMQSAGRLWQSFLHTEVIFRSSRPRRERI